MRLEYAKTKNDIGIDIIEDTKVKYTGLCVNCDNREDCKIRNSDYVIWHCEEYL